MPFRYCYRRVQTIPFISLCVCVCVYLGSADLLMVAPKRFCDGRVLTKRLLTSKTALYPRVHV